MTTYNLAVCTTSLFFDCASVVDGVSNTDWCNAQRSIIEAMVENAHRLGNVCEDVQKHMCLLGPSGISNAICAYDTAVADAVASAATAVISMEPIPVGGDLPQSISAKNANVPLKSMYIY